MDYSDEELEESQPKTIVTNNSNSQVDNDNDDDGEIDDETARARAEVSVLQEGNQNLPTGGGRRTTGGAIAATTTGEEALIGAPGEGVGAFDIVDPTGELVKARFQEFLETFYEEIEVEQEGDDADDFMNDNQGEREIIKTYPYLEQIASIAKHITSQTYNNEDEENEDEENDEENFAMPASGLKQTLLINHKHLMMIPDNGELAEAIEQEFIRFEPFLRRAARTLLADKHPGIQLLLDSSSLQNSSNANFSSTRLHVSFYNLPKTVPVRQLRTDQVGRLSSVSGTVTRTSDVRPELLVGSFRCNKCGLLAENIQQQFYFTRPTICRNPRCQNSNPNEFILDCSAKASEFVDWQKLRVQENSHEIPAGSMPRSIDVVLRGEMVERAKAGDVCVFTGSLVVIPDGSALARAGESALATKDSGVQSNKNNSEAATGGGGGVKGLKALGVRELTYRTCFVVSSVIPMDILRRTGIESHQSLLHLFSNNGSMESIDQTPQEVAMELSPAEREEIRQMKSSPGLYNNMVESIAPNTFGHKEVKRGILLMLLGGTHKTTAEGIKLRGDINVCIVGDPSMAKSQFLKYVHSFLPSRCVYTSGKASSAAGLTASIQRDADTGEFCIEAGALMLADNGICCIDEFDKMDQMDQVAIHEAMEQQTISITKAGIQATLNARASILAAANPIYGRYDRSKTLKANVALSAPILSRFDLFFVILDDCDEMADYNVAQHILKVHRCEETEMKPPFSKEQLQRYIRFARTINPVITPESQQVIVDCYKKLRQGDSMGRSRSAYRITVRQLESMIRLSEALARLHCDDEVKPAYVREAFRLLKKSIIHVETEDVTFDDEEDDDDEGEENDEVRQVDNNKEQNVENDENIDTENDENDQQVSNISREAQQEEEETSKKRKKKKKKKKKTQITFEEYESISSAISTYLRSKEQNIVEDDDDDNNDEKEENNAVRKQKYCTWGETVEWYLGQCEGQIGDSEEERDRLTKLTNLVIRRLINVDRVLIYIGESEGIEDSEKTIAVHPNYAV